MFSDVTGRRRTRVVYEVYLGDASNGYNSAAIVSFTVDQASDDAGGSALGWCSGGRIGEDQFRAGLAASDPAG